MSLRSGALRLSPALARLQRRQMLLRVTLVPARGLADDKYTDRMKKTGRPVSPHVTIYAFPAAALSSIAVRVTGCILSVGVTGVAGVELMGLDSAALMSSLGTTPVGPVFKFAVAYSLIYHWLGAARHYVWDNNPEMLQNAQVKNFSLALFGAAGVASLGLACV